MSAQGTEAHLGSLPGLTSVIGVTWVLPANVATAAAMAAFFYQEHRADQA